MLRNIFLFLFFWSSSLLCMNHMARHYELRQNTGWPMQCVTLVNDYAASKYRQGYLVALSPDRKLMAFVTPADGFCAFYNTRNRVVEKVAYLKSEGTNDHVKSVDFADNTTLMALVGTSIDDHRGTLQAYYVSHDMLDYIEDAIDGKDIKFLQRNVQGHVMLYSRITENILSKDVYSWNFNIDDCDFDIVDRKQSAWKFDQKRRIVVAVEAPLIRIPEGRKVSAVGLSLGNNSELGFIRPDDWVILHDADTINVRELLAKGLHLVEQEEREVRDVGVQRRGKGFVRNGVHAVVGAAALRIVQVKVERELSVVE